MLKIYSQNLWSGEIFGPLRKRLIQVRDQFHIFCFQEVLRSANGVQPYTPLRTNLLAELEYCLPDHQPLYCNLQAEFDPESELAPGVDFGQAIFLHPALICESQSTRFIFRTENALPPKAKAPVGWGLGRAIQVVRVRDAHTAYVIGNVHGLWHPNGKGDLPERLLQSRHIVAAMGRAAGDKKIIIGDFNLLPHTQSICMIEAAGYRNLITEYAITDTRTVFYHKTPRLADYAFVSPAVTVHEFRVDQSPISDHAALILGVT
jgi:hypothetical protein